MEDPPAKSALVQPIRRNISWLESMLAAPDGSRGIWERIRLHRDEIVFWVRPDCTAEAMLAFAGASKVLSKPELAPLADRLCSALLDMQWETGVFPFYQWRPPVSAMTDQSASAQNANTQFANDNGKVLELLCLAHQDRVGDQAALARAVERLADYLCDHQTADGRFAIGSLSNGGPCFLSWPILGLARAYHLTGDDRYRATGLVALRRLVSMQLPSGRLRTTYEVERTEDWRPVSSETAEALRAFAMSQRLFGEDLSGPIKGATRFLTTLTDGSGGIRNCDESSAYASLQCDPTLTDLVYTDGYALHAWIDLWRTTGSKQALENAGRLAGFLASIQCSAPGEIYDGAWRGSYDIDRRGWRGRADQNNSIDEGGAGSVYTGWCNATITNGMIRLIQTETMQ